MCAAGNLAKQDQASKRAVDWPAGRDGARSRFGLVRHDFFFSLPVIIIALFLSLDRITSTAWMGGERERASERASESSPIKSTIATR